MDSLSIVVLRTGKLTSEVLACPEDTLGIGLRSRFFFSVSKANYLLYCKLPLIRISTNQTSR